MFRYLLIFLLLAPSVFADVDSLKGTSVTFDNALFYSSNTKDTMNYGNASGQTCGWTNASGLNGNYLLGVNASSVISSISGLGHSIDSITVRLSTNLATGSNNAPRIGAIRAPTNWIEGTNSGTYTSTMSSFKYRGSGTGWTGETVTAGDWGITYPALVDSVWNFWNNAANPSSLFRLVGTEPFVTQTDSGFWTWNVTTQFTDSINAGRNYLAILFVDTTHTHSGSQHDRWRPRATEDATALYQPTFFFYHSLHVAPDSTWLRIAVTVPAGTVTNMPVLVNWLTYPDNASNMLTFYAADSTTKLYWCPDSLSGHYNRVWVRGNWAGGSDSIFVRRLSNSSYMNCDSVFLLYADFHESDALELTLPVSSPITDDFSLWNAVWVDTAAPFLTFYEGVGDADESDSLYRENSRIIYDWQESDPNLRYKWFYTGQQTRPDPGRYSGNWLHWASAPSWSGTWTKRGYLLDAVADTINVEDFNVNWSSYWSKWVGICENHNYPNSDVDYGLGMYMADSLDGAWTFVKDILADSTIGWPTNWLSREQASPAVYVNDTGDSAWCVFEAFSVNSPDAANSRVGCMVSFNSVGTGDSVFYDWYLMDSTGAINVANPMPIIRTDVVGQPDRYSTVPDFFTREESGDWFMSNHGAGPLCFVYSGSQLNAANFLMHLPMDSSVIMDDWGWDEVTQSWIGAVGRDTFAKSGQDTCSNRSAVMRMRMENFDSTRWDDSKWTIHLRSTRPTSSAHYQTGTFDISDGIFTMYPIQYMETGVAALMSVATFTAPYVVEMRCQETTPGFLDQYNLTVSLGDDTLQSYTGGQTTTAAWNIAGTQRGFRLTINPTATRFRKDSVGVAEQSIGSSIALPPDSIDEFRTWRIYHTSEDSLIFTINDVSKIRTKNPEVAYTSTAKHLVIAQSEEALLNRGGVFRADWIRVRKESTGGFSTLASDTLYAENNSTDDSYWGKHLKWWNGGW